MMRLFFRVSNTSVYAPAPTIVDVDIEYSINRGITWNTARRFKAYDTGLRLGDPIVGLTASFFGDQHTFYWDHVNDIGLNNVNEAKLRVRVREQR